ncbi:MAG: lactate utilization protein C [Betaproteobacteria bacterium]|nr:lactate utilization protein C [Betaproteobacteria bacterium]
MTARENILARIRARQGKSAAPGADEREAVRAHIAAHPQSPRPRAEWEPVARFREQALRLSSTVDEVEGLDAVPPAVARYLNHHGLPLSAVCWREFAGLDWRAAGIDVEARAARDTDLVGITGAFCAIAETGTLMTLSGRATPATVSLLPETHIAIVSASRIVRGMEEAWQLMRDGLKHPPRAVNFISGPSRTADIEQTVTLGAHGPYRVHIVIVG